MLAANYTRAQFKGSFLGYFFKGILLLLLTVVTLGLASPYLFYWSTKYYFDHLEINGQPIRFTGNFMEYFLISILLFLLTIVTLGLGGLYWGYWHFKYFAARLEIPAGT